MRHVDLCSGIGGFALGFEWAGLSRPVMFCDIEPWSRKVLAKHWPDVPIEEDVKVLANEPEKIPAGGRNTILTAGYPCQPFSQAGKRLGTEDDRHIWPYIREIVAQKRPAWCVFENVYGHVSMGLDQVLSDLEADGYATRAFIVPACGVDAPHRRDRVWIVAHANSEGEPNVPRYAEEGERMVGDPEHDGSSAAAVAGSAGKAEERRAEGQGKAGQSARTGEPGDHADVGNAEGIGRHGWAEEAGRARQTHQPDEPRPEIRGELGGSGEDVANADSARQQQSYEKLARGSSEQFDSGSFQPRENVANTSGGKREWRGQGQVHGQRDISIQSGRGGESAQRGRSSQSNMGGMVDGISTWLDEPRNTPRTVKGYKGRADRLKGLGNAIVPQIAMRIGIAIRQCEASATGQSMNEKES